jgi:acetyl-CoA C-acetyltransferase
VDDVEGEEMAQREVVICQPVRTAIGSFNGALKNISAVELGAATIRETIKRAYLGGDRVDSVLMGNVIQAGNKMNPARQAAVGGGIQISAPAMTVNRVCGSGAQAVLSAATEIMVGLTDIAVAGGMENMDQAPYLLDQGRWGSRMGDGQVLDSMLRDGLVDAFSGQHSGWHTEDLVTRYGISREAQDEWALRSHRRFCAAQANRMFDEEIVPIEVQARKEPFEFARDEAPRPDTNLEALSRLRPAFRPDGSITAGNAPGLNSGAAAMIVTHFAAAEKNAIEPWARLVGFGVSALEPGMFGLGPVSAVKAALARAEWSLGDIERIEINEAFAAVPLAVLRDLGLPEDIANVDGGAIAHGHPIGATGAVLVTRLLHSMRRDGLTRGVVTLCIGGGQGIALALEAF